VRTTNSSRLAQARTHQGRSKTRESGVRSHVHPAAASGGQFIFKEFGKEIAMQIEHIKQWFATAVPEPSLKSKLVQLGCHFEEVGEMFHAIEGGNGVMSGILQEAADDFKVGPQNHVQVQFAMRMMESIDRKALLDALCDQIVTAVGVAHMFGLDIIGALAEVDRSNWSKFVDGKPVFDANGKIAKPDTYSPPNLEPYA
jgi:predicted HAD superfamily Cof-like phosphohydrolase